MAMGNRVEMESWDQWDGSVERAEREGTRRSLEPSPPVPSGCIVLAMVREYRGLERERGEKAVCRTMELASHSVPPLTTFSSSSSSSSSLRLVARPFVVSMAHSTSVDSRSDVRDCRLAGLPSMTYRARRLHDSGACVTAFRGSWMVHGPPHFAS